MGKVRIMWSNISEGIGKTALKMLATETSLAKRTMIDEKHLRGVEIVAGVSYLNYGDPDLIPFWEIEWRDRTLEVEVENFKWYYYKDIASLLKDNRLLDFDVLINFPNNIKDNGEVFNAALECAVCAGKPFITSSQNLSDRQKAALYSATNRIPVFCDEIFHFRFKMFLDEVVEFARNQDGRLTLFESFYEDRSLPSIESGIIQREVLKATGKEIEVCTNATLSKESLIQDWWVDSSPSPGNTPHLCVRTFDEYADNILKIAKIMAVQTVQAGEFYTLNQIMSHLSV